MPEGKRRQEDKQEEKEGTIKPCLSRKTTLLRQYSLEQSFFADDTLKKRAIGSSRQIPETIRRKTRTFHCSTY